MNGNVYWVLELALQPNQHSDFTTLMREMVDAASAEIGTLNYEWNISADGATCHVYVRYQDSAAVMAHMRSVGTRFSVRFTALARFTRMTVYGAPSAEVKQALAPYGPIYLRPIGGFKR